MSAPMVIHEDDFQQFAAVCDQLKSNSDARAVFLIDKNGQMILATGNYEDVDTTALASLTAGNIAAADGLAKLIGEREFSVLVHQGEHDSLHISLVASQLILVVMFGEESSLGLVRMRVSRATDKLAAIVEEVIAKSMDPSANSPFAELTDDDIDIDNLFG